jgi:hypothetical protein
MRRPGNMLLRLSIIEALQAVLEREHFYVDFMNLQKFDVSNRYFLALFFYQKSRRTINKRRITTSQ